MVVMGEIEELKKRYEELERAVDALGEALKENPVSPKCERILGVTPSKEECFDFRAVRARVLCNAWALMEAEKVPFATAIKRAWDKVKSECAGVSAYI